MLKERSIPASNGCAW